MIFTVACFNHNSFYLRTIEKIEIQTRGVMRSQYRITLIFSFRLLESGKNRIFPLYNKLAEGPGVARGKKTWKKTI